ncbi:MAG: hypothetical protein H0W88_06085 [Parachlamydiaceae bacterium]|nr:hypothetical protein [Parachlamydiaceae bacterium]
MSMNTNSSMPPNGWRTFDSLDLEKPALKQKFENPLQKRLKGLDLASNAMENPALRTARKMNEYSNRTAHDVRGPLFPSWSNSMPKYSSHKIATTNSNEITCESMQVKIQGEISAVVKGVDYNGLHVVNEFINFFERERKKDPKINSVEIFHRFQPTSENEATHTHGSTCVGKALDIVKRLKEKKVEAHVIVESEGRDEPATHAAVAVPCKDGILLVDIERDVPMLTLKPKEPFIKLYPGRGPTGYSDKENPDLTVLIEIVETPGNYKTPTPLIVKKEKFTTETATKKNSCTQFILRSETNPDLSVMKRWLVSSHTWYYPVASAAREGEEQHSFQVNVAYGTITFNIGNKKFRIPLDAFDPKKRTIDRSKLLGDKGQQLSEDQIDFILGKEADGNTGGEFFKAFKTSKDLLMDQVFNIIAHKKMLKNLREK